MIHYIQRSFIFPFLIKGGKDTPFLIFLMAFAFCLTNGYLQSRYLTQYVVYPHDWLSQPCFLVGVFLFFTGMYINIQSDSILRNLRKPGETGYKTPVHSLYTPSLPLPDLLPTREEACSSMYRGLISLERFWNGSAMLLYAIFWVGGGDKLV